MGQFFNANKEEANKEVYTSLFEQLEKSDELLKKAEKERKYYKELLNKKSDKENEQSKKWEEKWRLSQKECIRYSSVIPEENKNKIKTILNKKMDTLKSLYNESDCSLEEKVKKIKKIMLGSNYSQHIILTLSMQEILKEKNEEEVALTVIAMCKNDSQEKILQIFAPDDEIYSKIAIYQESKSA